MLGFDSDPVLSVCAVGDIALFGTMQDRYHRDRVNPFEYIAALLDQYDLRVGNFEFPFSRDGVAGSWESFVGYRVYPEAEPMLDGVLFDVLSLANNHTMDWGIEGLLTTRSILTNRGVRCLGAGMNLDEARQSLIIERKGIRLGFLARTKKSEITATPDRAGAAPILVEDVCADIAALRLYVDYLILLLHWGIEFCPYPYRDDIAAGHRFIEAGADVILGHHAHVVQGIERYQNGLIFYGLGNFIYDDTGERIPTTKFLDLRRQCLLIQLCFIKGRPAEYKLVPCRIGENSQTRVLQGDEAVAMLDWVEQISAGIGDQAKFNAIAMANSWNRIKAHYLYYLRRDGVRFLWRLMRQVKPRYFRILLGHLLNQTRRQIGCQKVG